MTLYNIGLAEALVKTFDRLTPLEPVDQAVDEVCGLTAAEDCVAAVDCPSAATSLKDGYAVISADLEACSKAHPSRLKITGMAAAGDDADVKVEPGTAVKVMTGARIPGGATAVVAIEFTRESDGWVLCHRDAKPGRNILPQGSDVTTNRPIATRGEILTPAKTGLLAAGGIHTVRVHPRPRVGVIATGDEVVAPGRPLKAGQLYASNLVTLVGWSRHFQIEAKTEVARDNRGEISTAITTMLKHADVLLTSGGAWKSERDLTTKILSDMGAETIFQRVRMGPGKATVLALMGSKPIFCLPGGPPSNEMAFLQIALPGLLHLACKPPVPFPLKTARLSTPVGGDGDWTQFLQAKLEQKGRHWWVTPLKLKSRLQSQAKANAIIEIPEGVEHLAMGAEIRVQKLF